MTSIQLIACIGMVTGFFTASFRSRSSFQSSAGCWREI